MLQQRVTMNLYSFNKVSWFTGYDNKGQHFEKWRSATSSYDNIRQMIVGMKARKKKLLVFIGCHEVQFR